MALILLIETSTSSCSVALSENEQILFVKELNERNVHASHITLFIEEVLKTAGKASADLDAVAVSMGPGSYTGLRIGVSAAKGLCYALDIPLIAISTLKGMAAGIRHRVEAGSLLCPMIDARRMEVYTAVFDHQLNEVSAVEAKIIDGESFAGLLSSHSVAFFGDGAEKCMESLSVYPNARFFPGFENSATHLAELAYLKYQNNEFENVAYFEPYYLKDFLVSKPKAAGVTASS